jgi:hypothetical protein
MIDIVERIRQNQCPDIMNCNVNPYCSCADLEDAATTIEQLRAELAALRGQLAEIIGVLRKELPSKKWGWSDE